ncbi:MAG: PH domain-containing protein [Thermoplasmatota archaeon]
MAEPLPVDYLQPDEEMLEDALRHPASIVDDLLAALILSGLLIGGLLFWTLGFQPRFFLPVAVPGMALIGGSFLLFAVLRWWRVQTSRYVITPERVYKSYGRFRFFLMQTTYDKVTDLHVKQSLWGRIGGFGTVRVETAGAGVVFEGVHAPFAFKQAVETARSAFIEHLVGTRSKQTKAKPTEAPDTAETLWTGKPQLASMIGGMVGALMALVIGGGTLLTSSLLGMQAFIMAGTLGVIGLATAASVYIRFRYTNYQVRSAGVVVTSGWLSRKRVETRYEKVTDVMVYQNLLGRILGYGNITINTAGSNQAPVQFHGLGDPERIKAIIDEARR